MANPPNLSKRWRWNQMYLIGFTFWLTPPPPPQPVHLPRKWLIFIDSSLKLKYFCIKLIACNFLYSRDENITFYSPSVQIFKTPFYVLTSILNDMYDSVLILIICCCLLQPDLVCLRAPVSESLSRLHREQLQKFAQYLISELPQQVDRYTIYILTTAHILKTARIALVNLPNRLHSNKSPYRNKNPYLNAFWYQFIPSK